MGRRIRIPPIPRKAKENKVMLEKVKLGKDWNAHPKGSTVEVDSVRAAWLRKNDFEESKVVQLASRRRKE